MLAPDTWLVVDILPKELRVKLSTRGLPHLLRLSGGALCSLMGGAVEKFTPQVMACPLRRVPARPSGEPLPG